MRTSIDGYPMCTTCHGTFATLNVDVVTGLGYCARDWRVLMENRAKRATRMVKEAELAAGHCSDMATCAKEVMRLIGEGKTEEAINLTYYIGQAAIETEHQLRLALDGVKYAASLETPDVK